MFPQLPLQNGVLKTLVTVILIFQTFFANVSSNEEGCTCMVTNFLIIKNRLPKKIKVKNWIGIKP
jgi:hypothetical protein